LCLNEDYVTLANSLLKPKPLNDPFDKSVTLIDLEKLSKQTGYDTSEIKPNTIDSYFQYIFYLPYDDVAKEFIWGPGEYPHKENASYVVWTTANPPKYPDGVPYWTSSQTIVWKEQSEYTRPTNPDQEKEDYSSFAEKDIVDATKYACYNKTTREPLWDIFDPPKRVIKSTDQIINPNTEQPYW
jgi:hypothetical protein